MVIGLMGVGGVGLLMMHISKHTKKKKLKEFSFKTKCSFCLKGYIYHFMGGGYSIIKFRNICNLLG